MGKKQNHPLRNSEQQITKNQPYDSILTYKRRNNNDYNERI